MPVEPPGDAGVPDQEFVAERRRETAKKATARFARFQIMLGPLYFAMNIAISAYYRRPIDGKLLIQGGVMGLMLSGVGLWMLYEPHEKAA